MPDSRPSRWSRHGITDASIELKKTLTLNAPIQTHFQCQPKCYQGCYRATGEDALSCHDMLADFRIIKPDLPVKQVLRKVVTTRQYRLVVSCIASNIVL
jgi:hypothetical protein